MISVGQDTKKVARPERQPARKVVVRFDPFPPCWPGWEGEGNKELR